jgi:hypothetical protein
MWEDARIQAREERNARRLAGRQIAAQRAATVYREAYQLSASELDPITGEIFWPAALQCEKFAPQRAQLEQLIKQQFIYGESQPATAAEIARTVDLCSKALRREIGSLPRDEYSAAQKFLMGLKYSDLSHLQAVAKTRSIVPQGVAGTMLANQ